MMDKKGSASSGIPTDPNRKSKSLTRGWGQK
nr:MAG TPA: hypothetical protein [Caudoviricetes sp.]